MKMIKYIACAIIFLCHSMIHSLSAQDYFKQGNNLFMKGSFEQARLHYDKISEKSGSVWYNIGLCFYNEKKYAQAIVAWKRAQKKISFWKCYEILRLQQLAEERLGLPGNLNFISVIKSLLFCISYLMLYLFLLFMFLLWCVFYMRSKKNKRYNSKFMILFCVLGVSCGSILWYQKLIKEAKKEAVVIRDHAIMYVGPEKTFYQKMILPIGTIVEILAQDHEMYKISSIYNVGYVMPYSVEMV